MERIKQYKKQIAMVLAAVAVIGIVIGCIVIKGDHSVEFAVLSEEEYPGQVVSQVIPEYRKLERALACMIEDKVYIVATRGEKASGGYEINIEKMMLKEKDDKTILEVYANFKDPAPENAVGQALSYPLQVAKTELEVLPDQIELKVQYVD